MGQTKRPRILVLEALSGSGDCVVQAGGRVLEQNPRSVNDAAKIVDSRRWDGLLLTGGGDVDPRRYGQRPRKEVYGVSEHRDLVESYALEIARSRGLPVLGICRGHQMINIEAGGTLRQHVPGHRGTEHRVLSHDRSLLREFSGVSPTVVSLHHQRVETLGDGLEVTSRASDGTVESIESVDRRVLGVQFHPEMDYWQPYAKGLFRWLVLEAAHRAGLPEPRSVEHLTARRRRPRRSSASKQAPTLSRRRGSGITTSWICPHCAMRFDEHADRDDHVVQLHDGIVTLVPASMTTTREASHAGS